MKLPPRAPAGPQAVLAAAAAGVPLAVGRHCGVVVLEAVGVDGFGEVVAPLLLGIDGPAAHTCKGGGTVRAAAGGLDQSAGDAPRPEHQRSADSVRLPCLTARVQGCKRAGWPSPKRGARLFSPISAAASISSSETGFIPSGHRAATRATRERRSSARMVAVWCCRAFLLLFTDIEKELRRSGKVSAPTRRGRGPLPVP